MAIDKHEIMYYSLSLLATATSYLSLETNCFLEEGKCLVIFLKVLQNSKT